MCVDFFDLEWNHIYLHEPDDYPFAKNLPNKPLHYLEMIALSKVLSKGIPFVRVDFYECNSCVFF